MFCVGKIELLVVSEAELLIDVTVSALTTIRQPLNATNKASFFNILSSFYPDHSCGVGFINIIISNKRTLVVGYTANAMPTTCVENKYLSLSFFTKYAIEFLNVTRMYQSHEPNRYAALMLQILILHVSLFCTRPQGRY